MSNYCFYDMKIKGKKENVDKAISYLQADYSYKNDELVSCSADRHFLRVFEANVCSREDKDSESTAIISGSCAWSVLACMLNEDGSYYSKISKSGFPKNFKGTHIEQVSEELDLTIEIFGDENQEECKEHYVVEKGVIKVNEHISDYKSSDKVIVCEYSI